MSYYSERKSAITRGEYKRPMGATQQRCADVYSRLVDFALENHRPPSQKELAELFSDMKRHYYYSTLRKLKKGGQIDWEPYDYNTLTIKGIVYVDMR